MSAQPFFHREVYSALHQWCLSSSTSTLQCMPHLLISGLEGSGKKTLCRHWISLIYDSNVLEQSKLSVLDVANDSISFLQSPYHMEFVPENCPSANQHTLIQQALKQQANQPVLNFKQMFTKTSSSSVKFRIFVLHRINEWSLKAQHALRRIMEQSTRLTRFILTTSAPDLIIVPVRSRCVTLRLQQPSVDAIGQWLAVEHQKKLAPEIIERERCHLSRCLSLSAKTNVFFAYPPYHYKSNWNKKWLIPLLSETDLKSTKFSFFYSTYAALFEAVKHSAVSPMELWHDFVYMYCLTNQMQNRQVWTEWQKVSMYVEQSEGVNVLPRIMLGIFSLITTTREPP